MDFLKSAIASIAQTNSSFPYTVGEKVEFQNDTIWTIHHATRRSDGIACTVFEFDVNSQRSRLPLAKNAAKKLRTMKFPGIINIYDIYETEQAVMIATEHVVPFDIAIQSKDIMTPDVIKWGLYAVANTIKFINVDASSVHGNIRQSSVFITDAGEWKLSGFELLTSTKDEEPVIYTFAGLVPDARRFAPPEVGKGGWEALKKQPHHLLDSYLFGALIYEIFNGRFISSDQLQAATRKNIPPDLFGAFKKLTHISPRQRGSIKQFIEVGKSESAPGGGFFRLDMILLSENMTSLNVQSEVERDSFLKELQRIRSKFPPNYQRLKVLPALVQCFEFGGGGPNILAVMLDISNSMGPEEFQTVVAPTIVKMFTVPDRAIRLALLESMPKYIDQISTKIVNDKIFPELVNGFTDMAPAVREQTVKSVLIVVPKLSDRNINNDLLRYLARTQNDDQPGIRTNTTICLGKIAHNLGPHTRSRVLTTAFQRALKDPFVHARNASLMALAVTIDIFSAEDCCFKLLPAICPCLLDREKLVRTQAHKTMDIYLAKVNAHAAQMSEAGSAQPLTSTPQTDNTRTADANGSTSDDTSSWTGGWGGAFNGLAKRLVTDESRDVDQHGLPLHSASAPPTALANAEASVEQQVSRMSLAPDDSLTRPSSASSTMGFGNSKFEPDQDYDDSAWGQNDDEEENDDDFPDTAEDSWSSFDKKPAQETWSGFGATNISKQNALKPKFNKPTSLSGPTKKASTIAATTSTSNINKPKARSIAQLREKKKGNMFADTGAQDDEDNWGDGW
ncbi:armadillo-type protein [Lipomyces oligophaga]|uniref:armadillo-type protein n=1 Tax=Lipomyces oligophaga TaxID=45792 RepID=UPI0034CED0A2